MNELKPHNEKAKRKITPLVSVSCGVLFVLCAAIVAFFIKPLSCPWAGWQIAVLWGSLFVSLIVINRLKRTEKLSWATCFRQSLFVGVIVALMYAFFVYVYASSPGSIMEEQSRLALKMQQTTENLSPDELSVLVSSRIIAFISLILGLLLSVVFSLINAFLYLKARRFAGK